MDNEQKQAPLSFKEKVGYGLGDMASNFYLGFFGLFLLYYYTDVYGLAPAAVGTMLLVTKIVDAISDPAMGLIADRTNSRWGKYRPYLLWAAIPYGLTGFIVFFGPELSNTGKLVYAYITYTAVMLAYTAINVPYSALLAVISPKAEERTKATQFRFVFASAGTLAVAAFATSLTDWLGGGDELVGFRRTMLLFAVLSILMFWATFAFTRERIAPRRHQSSVSDDFRALLKNVSWLVLVATTVLVMTGIMVRISSTVFYIKYYMDDDGALMFFIFDRAAVFLSLASVGQLLGALVTPYFASRLEKHYLVLVLSVAHAGLLIICYAIPPEEFALIVTVHALGFFTFGATATLLFSMYTDCAEFGEWKNGKRTSGLIVSASLFSIKFGAAVGGAIPGFILAIFGFVANAVQTPTAMFGIRLMFNIAPAILMGLGGLCMVFYQINRAKLKQIEADMQLRRRARIQDDDRSAGAAMPAREPAR